MTTLRIGRAASLAAVLVVLSLAACGENKSGKTEPNDQPPASQTKRGDEKARADKKDEQGKAEKKEEHGAEARLVLTDEEIKTAGIQIEELKAQSLVDQVVLTATIRANQDRIAHVAPRVSARITKVNANLGDNVKQGQTLALLDSIELGEAHSAYQQAQSQFALAKSDFERAETLKADEIIPEKDYLRARSEYEKERASLRAAEDKLRLLGVSHSGSEKGPHRCSPSRLPFPAR
jgi:cobalt-zinc-cadmium efflux system membrane fusion protein